MPEILQLKSEGIDTPEKRSKYTVVVVGCEREGILYSNAFANASYKVICTDANQSLVKRLERGKSAFADENMENKLKNYVKKGQLCVTSEIEKAVSQSDITILAITPKIDAKKNPNYSIIESSCRQIGAALRRGTLVIYGGTAGFGFVEGNLKEKLENASGLRVGTDFGLAYCPITKEEQLDTSDSQELIVAATDEKSLDLASTLLTTITKDEIRKIPNIKIAELAVLFAATRREVNVALANELAIFCEKVGQDYFEIVNFLERDKMKGDDATNIFEEDNKNATSLLLKSADDLNLKVRLPANARQTNEDMIKHAIKLTQEALRSCGKTLRRSRIAILGMPRTETPATIFIKTLETKGARISIYDPELSENEPSDVTHLLRKTLNETIEGTDCIVILTKQDQTKRINFKKLHAAMKKPAAIVDLVGTVERDKVEKEELIYRSLGRGD